jgi:hypothetical protein
MFLRGARAVTNATVRGLAALQNRFAGAIDERAVKEALRKEAEALAAEARAGAPAGLAQSVEIRDESRGTGIAYAIGTPDPAGPALEFGTVRTAASPWLLPVFRARRGVVNDVLRNAVQAAFRRIPSAF